MTDNTNDNIPEITPLPVPPVGMPKVPITLFNVWTWSTPVIPSFYWNVYSQEQRIKQICKEIGRIEAYLDYISTTANQAHLEIDEHINKVYAELSKKIADLTQRLTTEVNRLDSLISAETSAREAGDAKLEAEITKETTERKAGDAKLTSDLEKEVQDRQDADEGLHQEISTETTARIHADDVLHQEISAEKTAREEADTAANASITQEVADRKAADDSLSKRIDAREAEDSKLEAGLATKLERNDLKASGKITITPGEGNTLTIGDTFEADFQALQNAISGLQASLASETSERRADDGKLWTAVNNRIERGKILAGEGISVVNDPDQSTVTISATGSTDLSEIEAKAEAAKNAADSASTTAGEAKSTAEAAQATATGAESKAEEALTAAQGSLKSVAHTASLAGDGTTSTPLALTPATATTLGGVKIGSGLAVTGDGVLSATAQGGGSGIAEVAHDETLKGTGSSSSPLGVNYGEGLTVAGGKLTAEVTQAELNAVDAKATVASTAAQEAKTAAQGSLKSVAVGTGLTGNGTASSPLAVKAATASSLGAVKVGSGLKVDEKGTLSTTASGLTKVAHGATLTGDGTAGHPLEVRTATESEAGVLTEARVRELGASGITEVTHDESMEGDGVPERPLKVVAGTKDQIGGVKEAENGSIVIGNTGDLIAREVTIDTQNPETAGMVSQNTIKWVATNIADPKKGLGTNSYGGHGIEVKVSEDSALGFNSSGEIAFKLNQKTGTVSGETTKNLPDSDFREGMPDFITSVGSDGEYPAFWLVNAEFYVKEKGASNWTSATRGAFEAFIEGDSSYGSLLWRCTPYGAKLYAEGDSLSITAAKCHYSVLRIVCDAVSQ